MQEERLKPLPVGHSFFDRVIRDNYYYVDKSLFIRDLLDKGAMVTLCTRPRRFGKTLNQTMLKCFFEDTSPLLHNVIGGKNTRALFNGLKIESSGEDYMRHQGKYPVIYLSFKDAKINNFEGSYNYIKDEIIQEFNRHYYVIEKISREDNKVNFEKLCSNNGTTGDYSRSLRLLCECLEDYHGEKAVVLIDEYDVPLENSWSCGFYDEMINFIRPLMAGAFKDNPSLQLAVITGCLRISKESIFTGLNNLSVVSILSDFYDEHFGFTQSEMDYMLKYYSLECKTQIIKDWYDGYLFGRKEVYNPWSSIQVISNWQNNIDRYPEPHWANTSSNDIVRRLIDIADNDTRDELEILISGGTITKLIHEDITYNEIEKSPDNLWNFLFFTGYLKKINQGIKNEDGEISCNLTIPNIELRYIFKTKVKDWFSEKIKQKDFSRLYDAVLNGSADIIKDELNDFLVDVISYMDGRESFYHGVMIGVLSGMRHFSVKSNREAGTGRCDIVMRHASGRGKAVLFEIKYTEKMSEIEKKCEEALNQIKERQYAKELEAECYKDIIQYAVSFCKKSCEVLKYTC